MAVKCLLLLCQDLIVCAASTHCCASSGGSSAVVRFLPAYLSCAGCTAVTVVNSP